MDKLKKWRRLYKYLGIFVYAIYLPVSTIEWLFFDERFPLSAIAIAGAFPFIKQNHLKQLESKHSAEK